MRFFRKAFFRIKGNYIKPSKSDVFGKTSVWPLLPLFKHKTNIAVAELGVYKAESSIAMLEEWNIDRFYAIDLWKPYREYVDKEKSITTQDLLVNNGDNIYNAAKEKIDKYQNTYIIRDDSLSAANQIQENSLDFCFIDANHEYEYVMKDINAWLPKIKSGGVLSGHDYHYKPVRCAVFDALVKKGLKLEIRGYHHSGWPSCWYVFIK